MNHIQLHYEQISWHNIPGVNEMLTTPAVLDFSTPSCPAYTPSANACNTEHGVEIKGNYCLMSFKIVNII